MITHDEVRKVIEIIKPTKDITNQRILTWVSNKDLDKFMNYITQQEKKDKLLGLYKEQAYLQPYTSFWLTVDEKIKELEDELK